MSPGIISPLSSVKALLFDVFGTAVDWRTSVTEELTLRTFRKLSTALPPHIKSRLETLTEEDWARFAQEWRNSYGIFTSTFDPSKDSWKPIDQHHRDSLVDLLQKWDLEGLFTDSEIDSLSLVWHRLSPWPDSPDGLAKLGDKYITATLSNGNISLLRDLDDFGSLGFHKLFSAETFKAYKPNPATYLGAVRELGLQPEEVALVAAHLGDLHAARACGLRTVYVERPQEENWGKDEERYKEAKGWMDLWVSEDQGGFEAVAERLLELE